MLQPKGSDFARYFRNPRKGLNLCSPEVRLMYAVCAGDEEAAAGLFEDTLQFSGEPSALDAPHGRFEGREGVRRFVRQWHASFGADRTELDPVVQTRAGGRSVLEFAVDFYRSGALFMQFPMIIVGDLRGMDKLDGARLYFHFAQAPGFSPYRRPIFQSQHLTPCSAALLSGAVRAYFEALHRYPHGDAERLKALFSDHIVTGGYFPGDKGGILSAEESRAHAGRFADAVTSYIPLYLDIRPEVIVDDGITCVIEWVHVIHREGRERAHRLCESGISVYEREESGKLCSVRILDYANCEDQIDWSRESITKEEAQRINYTG